ncbi:hypothetical protein IV203_010632 [Nitzschia inconspicua]|uniref:Uncharacterized protein n=1 Tax=Nitzschia inconspicua TaxID=303405 RepID=A0A9K3KWL4_9STRA|nr:hypothetical protein IV203_010632 [Nitzschia inconspicua]
MSIVRNPENDDELFFRAKRQLRELGFESRPVECQMHSETQGGIICHRACCMDCRTRLFHITQNGEEIIKTLIHCGNQKQFVPEGPVFNGVSNICQQLVQRQLMRCYNLRQIPVHHDDQSPINCLASPSFFDDISRPLLIIIPGKGASRAGILSTKQLVLSGMQVGSAAFLIQKATQYHNMAVLILDPNARGPQSGGYLVRYLLLGECRNALRQNLCAICFTDSTHNIQWVKKEDPNTQNIIPLFRFLQSDRCLYIRNTATHPLDTFANSNDRNLGDTIPNDIHWQRRFGTIPTVWAGTTEHSLICWTSRHVIWDFFLRHLEGGLDGDE